MSFYFLLFLYFFFFGENMFLHDFKCIFWFLDQPNHVET